MFLVSGCFYFFFFGRGVVRTAFISNILALVLWCYCFIVYYSYSHGAHSHIITTCLHYHTVNKIISKRTHV